MIRKLRIQKIVIESTVDGNPVWIHVTGQELQYDDNGELSSVIPDSYYAHFTLDSAFKTMFDFHDPVIDKDCSNSGGGIADAVTKSALIVLQEKYGGTIENGKVCL